MMETLAALQGGSIEELRLVPGYADELGAAFAVRVEPTPLPDPYLIAFNPDVAPLIGLAVSEAQRPEFVRLAAGNARFRTAEPFAALYAGHQFGTFVPQLGDGRAITLGEFENPSGGRFEWQLKGAGITAFSRFGDGRAVLRSTIREYLASEALAALSIPTTRALAIVGSDAPVFREKVETAAVLSRIAPSHVRFGSFEVFHYRGKFEEVAQLADYVIERFYPEVSSLERGERYARFLREVTLRTARLFAEWQAVGFAHGVLNTDNMSILGLTLDYGPYGFLDEYEPEFICNHTDTGGRYSFERQATIGLWNCHALAAALSSLVPETETGAALAAYEPAFRARLLELLRAKFGLETVAEGDADLLATGLDALAHGKVDYTAFFRRLGNVRRASDPADDVLAEMFPNRDEWYAWLQRYRARLEREGSDDETRRAAMSARNPKYVLRNHLAQAAIEKAESRDYTELARLHAILRRPFDEQPENERYAEPPPAGASRVEVSCSS
jgi:uncharacterized protein YdiU (UPF0061 family)